MDKDNKEEISNNIKDEYNKKIIKDPIIDIFYKTKGFDDLNKKISFENKISLKSFENKINDKIILNYNPNYINKIQLTPLNLNISLFRDQMVTADNIGEFVLPLVDFIQQTQPDFVLACDRGARIIGMAVHMLYQNLYGKFPTRDHAVNFRRISKTNSEEEVEEYLKPLIEKMLKDKPNSTIVVLDDWIGAGVTQDRVRRMFDKYSHGQAKVIFGVLVGEKADITGKGDGLHSVDWHNDPGILGVDYSHEFDKEHKDFRPRVIRRPTIASVSKKKGSVAIEYRQRMSKHLEEFAKRVRRRKSP